MIWTNRRILAMASILLAAFCATMTFLAVQAWAGLHLPGLGAALAAALVTLAPPYLLNRALTASYQKTVDVPASELGSLFGCTSMICLGVLGALWLGMAGLPGRVSVDQAFRRAGSAVGLLAAPGSLPLDAYPEAIWDGSELVLPDVGTPGRPALLLRDGDGTLRRLDALRPGTRIDGTMPARVLAVQQRDGLLRLRPLQGADLRTTTVRSSALHVDEAKPEGRHASGDALGLRCDDRGVSLNAGDMDLRCDDGGVDLKAGDTGLRCDDGGVDLKAGDTGLRCDDGGVSMNAGPFFLRCRDGAVEIGGGGKGLPKGLRLRLGPTTTEIDTR